MASITTYAQLQKYITDLLTADGVPVVGGPHHAFWNTLSYTQFVTGTVPGVGMPILIKGDSAKSNIIMALRGTPGSPFDPNTGDIGQMPAGAAPFTEAQIKPIADWIDAGCPE